MRKNDFKKFNNLNVIKKKTKNDLVSDFDFNMWDM